MLSLAFYSKKGRNNKACAIIQKPSMHNKEGVERVVGLRYFLYRCCTNDACKRIQLTRHVVSFDTFVLGPVKPFSLGRLLALPPGLGFQT